MGQDVAEISDLRLLLAMEAVRLASATVTTDPLTHLGELADRMIAAGHTGDVRTILAVNPVFHALIWEWSSNGRLHGLLGRYYDQVSLYLAASLRLQIGQQRMRMVWEHRQMVDAMAAGDDTGAMEVMVTHLTEAERLLRLFMSLGPSSVRR